MSRRTFKGHKVNDKYKANTSETPESEKDCAQTPIWFMRSLENLLQVEFDLDVCALPMTAKCDIYFSLENDQDGLKEGWSLTNWCNPPFSNILPWEWKAVEEAKQGASTAILMPNNPETAYVRHAKEHADTVIEMPFRMKFLRPDGEPFVSQKTQKEQSPQFSCLVAWYTPLGLISPTRNIYYDFREGFYE